MQWIAADQSGIDFLGNDSDGVKGPISKAQDALQEQEDYMRTLIRWSS